MACLVSLMNSCTFSSRLGFSVPTQLPGRRKLSVGNANIRIIHLI